MMGAPSVRLGTKWPSITSTCSQSAPNERMRLDSSARRAKSHERREGAMMGAGREEEEEEEEEVALLDELLGSDMTSDCEWMWLRLSAGDVVSSGAYERAAMAVSGCRKRMQRPADRCNIDCGIACRFARSTSSQLRLSAPLISFHLSSSHSLSRNCGVSCTFPE